MTSAQSWIVHASNLLVGGTGVAYGWMRYFIESDDPYSVVNHPWQPHAQHLHILCAPLLVFAAGLLWSGHVTHHYQGRQKHRRRTGISLALLLCPMIVSGYAIQVSVEDSWRTIWVVLHVATSVAWIVMGLAHPFLRSSQSD